MAVTAAVGLAGCGEREEESEELPDEALAAAAQALQPATCVTVRRGVLGDVHDGFLSGDYPWWRTGAEHNLWTGLSSGGNENKIIVSFDLDFLPAYSIVTSATFMIYVSWSMSNTTVRAHEVLVPWEEDKISTDNFPAAGGYSPTVLGSYQTDNVGFGTIDITALAKAWVNGSKDNNGILLEEDPVATHHSFSSESSLWARPALAICYVNGPAPHRGGALVSGGVTGYSESYRFIGTMGEGPGNNHVGESETVRFLGGLVGATQE